MQWSEYIICMVSVLKECKSLCYGYNLHNCLTKSFKKVQICVSYSITMTDNLWQMECL